MEGVAEPRSVIQEQQAPLPLVVDLDGTLLRTDLLVESLVALLKEKPSQIFLLPFWLLKGKAHLKAQLAARVTLDAGAIPYREDLIDYLRAEHSRGRTLVLATAADAQFALRVARRLELFDMVLSSDGETNLSGRAKRERLIEEFGERGFDYIGNSCNDLPVWFAARKAVLVDPNERVLAGICADGGTEIDRIFRDRRGALRNCLRALRPSNWLKNLLVLGPLLIAHRIEPEAIGRLLLAFAAFGCIASCGYIINDLLDLRADRRHPHKRLRPFASGALPLSYGLAMIPGLFAAGCLLGLFVSDLFLIELLAYFALSLTYSLALKRIVVLDVIVLAGFYSLRLLAGCAAVSILPSHWLLAFSTFLFFSLALVKRYGELMLMNRVEENHRAARGYERGDAELLAAMGIASGYLAVLVLALYISSKEAPMIYRRYELLWFLCPLLFYWISHVWLVAHRGKMPDDPVVFALNDRLSRILGALIVGVIALAL